MNEYGIMDGSFVSIAVISARNLRPLEEAETCSTFVKVTVEGKIQRTKIAHHDVNPWYDVELRLYEY